MIVQVRSCSTRDRDQIVAAGGGIACFERREKERVGARIKQPLSKSAAGVAPRVFSARLLFLGCEIDNKIKLYIYKWITTDIGKYGLLITNTAFFVVVF